MTRTTSLKATAGALALIAAAALATAACGREGSLERPGPMFGLARAAEQPQDHGRPVPQAPASTRNTTSDAAADARANANATGDDDNAPTTARDIRDPAQRLTPLSAAPIQGLSDPLGPPVSTKPPG